MSERTGKYRLTDMKLDFVSLVGAGDDPMAQVVIAKSAPETTNPPAGGPMAEKVSKDDLDPTVAAYIESLENEVETLSKDAEDHEAVVKSYEAQIEKMVPKDDEAAEEISKAALEKMDPATRSIIEKQQDRIAKAEADAKIEKEARLGQVFLSKAEALPMLSEDKTDLAGLLRRVADALPAEDVTKWDAMLTQANTEIAKGALFSEFGVGGGDTTVSKSVLSKAEELRKQDPSLTIEQAQAKVYENDPTLLDQAMTHKEG